MRKVQRRNYRTLALVAVCLWVAWGGLVWFFVPEDMFVFAAFYILLFLAILLTTVVLLRHLRRGALCAIFVTLSLGLRQMGLGSWIDVSLLLALFIVIEVYISKYIESPREPDKKDMQVV